MANPSSGLCAIYEGSAVNRTLFWVVSAGSFSARQMVGKLETMQIESITVSEVWLSKSN